MNTKVLSILLVALVGVTHAERKPKKAKPMITSITGTEAHVYKTIGDVELRLFVCKPEGHSADKKLPAAVFFFGGGWNGGTPTQFEAHIKYLATRGMIGIVADYRVKSRQDTTPFECVKDGKSAVRWLRANAGKLGIDPDRLAAGGGSAGGHVAAATATVPGLEEESEDMNISSRPNALLLFNPVYDNGPKGYGHSRVADRYKEISPFHNINKGMPPTIVFFGTVDKLVPVATAEAFKQKMIDVGSTSELHLYDGQPHGFFNTAKSGGKYYRDTVHKMDKFLASLGWLDGEPTITPDE